MKKLLLIFLSFPFFVCAEELHTSKTITVTSERASLSNNYDSQSSNSIELFLKRSDNFMGGIKAEKVSRYGLNDSHIEGSFIAPISKELQGTISYTRADKGVFIPKTIISGKLLYDFNNSFLVSLARKSNKYTSGAQSDTSTIEFINYYKNFRFSYAHDVTDVKNAGQSTNDKITAHYFYDNHHTAISLSSGKELEALENGSVLSLDVKSMAVYGQYWPLKKWGLGYSADYGEQGDLYIKKGASLAVIHRF